MFYRLLLLALAAMAATPARADLGTIDDVAAATLLFPHFEVNPTAPNGVNTILTVQNTSASAGVVSVTLWTDYGIPTAKFNLYLTGYDTETLDLRAVLNRAPPVTADAGDDPTDQISPKGPISQDINFPGFNSLVSGGGSYFPRSLIAAHTGQASDEYFGGLCGARNYGDGIARGYVTMDDYNNQNNLRPDQPGYFSDIGFRNIWTGSYMVLEPARGRVYTDGAVAVEASPNDPLVSTPGNLTFYSRFNGSNASDRREPLPTAWAGRYASGRTDVDTWRDPGVSLAPFACGGAPLGLPSGQRAVIGYDGNGAVVGTPAGNLFPFVAGTTLGSSLSLNQPLGWLFVNLNPSAGVIRQSWMTFRQIPSSAPTNGRMGYSVPGIQLGNAAFGADPAN